MGNQSCCAKDLRVDIMTTFERDAVVDYGRSSEVTVSQRTGSQKCTQRRDFNPLHVDHPSTASVGTYNSDSDRDWSDRGSNYSLQYRYMSDALPELHGALNLDKSPEPMYAVTDSHTRSKQSVGTRQQEEEVQKQGTPTTEKPELERQRSNAIQIKSVEAPKEFREGNQFWVQDPLGHWERVTIETWNHWNGTWQVRDSFGESYPASPIALKNENEYAFLSRERVFEDRRFSLTG